MSRSKQISKAKGRRKTVTAALGVAGALSLASGASASLAPGGDMPTQTSAPELLAEEEIFVVSLSTFYFFDRESAFRPSLQLAARGCGHGCGHGCGCRGCAVHRACGGCGVHRACRGCARGCAGCGGGCCCLWIGPVRVCYFSSIRRRPRALGLLSRRRKAARPLSCGARSSPRPAPSLSTCVQPSVPSLCVAHRLSQPE